MTDTPQNIIERHKEKIVGFWKRYQTYAPAAFFVLGFMFDIITLGRIDHWLTITQQAVYLIAIAILLSFFLMDYNKEIRPPKFLKIFWRYRKEVLHFLMGALLSAYTIFYFKSSSIFTSFTFLLLLVILLIINELPRFQKLGLEVKFAIYSLCLISYFSYLIPIFIGTIGPLPLLLSVFASLIFLFLLTALYAKLNIDILNIKKIVIRPALIVIAVFVYLYSFGLIPPVPLSLKYIGIYHDISRGEDNKFELHHERPFWRFWNNGDQNFDAMPGDKIICFARIFSPTHFKESVNFHWQFDHPKLGWQTMDNIKMEVHGGRDEGFRAYSTKGNYQPGDWRVKLETADGREVGRISFSVTEIEPEIREYKIDRF